MTADAPLPASLDPAAAAVLARLNRLPLPDSAVRRPWLVRAAYALLCRMEGPPAGDDVDSRQIALEGAARPLRALIHRPRFNPETLPERPGLILHFHGGGFCIGSPRTHARVCRALARSSGAYVVSVGYRLGPEYRFPAAHDDAWAALQSARTQAAAWGANADRLVVAGESAGGNLAAFAARRAAREGGPRLAGQILFYPVVDMVNAYASRARFASGHFLTQALYDGLLAHYLPDGTDRGDPRLSPLLHPVEKAQAPALVVPAPFDMLYDEGVAYAGALEAAGVTTMLRPAAGLFHDACQLSRTIPAARAVVDAAGAWAAARLDDRPD